MENVRHARKVAVIEFYLGGYHPCENVLQTLHKIQDPCHTVLHVLDIVPHVPYNRYSASSVLTILQG